MTSTPREGHMSRKRAGRLPLADSVHAILLNQFMDRTRVNQFMDRTRAAGEPLNISVVD